MTGAGAPFHAGAERVSASVFPVLGIDPLLGRTFTAEEDTNAAPVTVISFALWQAKFQGDPGAVGKVIDLDRRPTLSSESCRRDLSSHWMRAG